MTNDEARITIFTRTLSFGFCHSFVLRHSCLGIPSAHQKNLMYRLRPLAFATFRRQIAQAKSATPPLLPLPCSVRRLAHFAALLRRAARSEFSPAAVAQAVRPILHRTWCSLPRRFFLLASQSLRWRPQSPSGIQRIERSRDRSL